jgi:hypothetical protein
MKEYIIIIATVVNAAEDLQSISDTLDQFESVKDWTIDLQDCDNILRISAKHDIAVQITSLLKQYNVDSKIMGIFEH